jgi:Tfp pilus assembly protein PilF
VLNNLAFLLAVQNRPGDAKELIDEAIQIFGPTSDLLDTRAIVELSAKNAKQAIADLDLATVDQPTGLKYFHLAQAHLANKDQLAAAEAMKKALETYKLDRKDLAPAEQPKFDAMLTELGLK